MYMQVREDDKAVHLVEELASGGELFDRIIELGHFSEKDAIEKDIAEGLYIEHACVHGNYYGTSIAAVKSVGEAGKVVSLHAFEFPSRERR